MIKFVVLFISLFSLQGFSQPSSVQSREMDSIYYQLDESFLRKGNFQYYFDVIKQDKEDDIVEMALNTERDYSASQLLEILSPLTEKTLQGEETEEKMFIAVLRMDYIIPSQFGPKQLNVLNELKYVESTLPGYEVEKKSNFFFIESTRKSPEMKFIINHLKETDDAVLYFQEMDSMLSNLKTKAATFHRNYDFGKLRGLFKTAQAAGTVTLYRQLSDQETLATQYIVSFNYPIKTPFGLGSKSLNEVINEKIKGGMLENLQGVVDGSRQFFRGM